MQPSHCARRQAHFDATQVRRRAREQLRDHTPRKFSGELVMLLHNVYGEAGLDLGAERGHRLDCDMVTFSLKSSILIQKE